MCTGRSARGGTIRVRVCRPGRALALGVVAVCWGAGVGWAQQAPPVAVPSPAPTPAPSPTPSPAAAAASSARPALLSGFVQVDERIGSDQGRNQPEHEFNVRRARLTVSGKVRERVTYSLTVQGDGANANTASLREYFADVTVCSWLKARVGQYKYDFDMEGRESGNVIPLPDRPFVVNAVSGSLTGASTASSAASDFRDRGLSLVGSTERGRLKWSYSVGVFQGAGRASDNNSKPGYTLGTSVEPGAGVRLNGGFLSSDNAAPGSADRNTYRAWTVGASYDRKRVFLRSEYYRARRERGVTDQELDGLYVTASFSPAARIDLLARYHAFNDERFPAGDEHMSGVDFGLKYYFDRSGRRSGTYLAAAYAIRNADPGVNSGLTLLNDNRGAALDNGRLVANVLVVRLQVRF